jgi:hypothetical protein
MPRFFIELTHGDEREACIRALHAIQQYGSHFVTHADWGCRDGTHAGWMIGEFDSRSHALQIVPPDMRPGARIVELNSFTQAEIAEMIEELSP